MDAQALLTPDAVERAMGMPLAHVPAPPGSSEPNYAHHFAGLFLQTFAGLGIHPQVYWMSERYAIGRHGPLHGPRARPRRRDPRDLPHGEHGRASRRLAPGHVICENCGRIGTTLRHRLGRHDRRLRMPARTSSTWATGCGFNGRVSPFGGRAKLVWNVDWAARWGLVGATIEGCGKDLATAGGSRDRADAITRRVFEREPPLNVPYEFLNIGGKKMSTSKGTGAAAHEIADLLPPDAHALPVPAQQTQARDRVRPGRRHYPWPLRRVRPHRRGHGGQARAR